MSMASATGALPHRRPARPLQGRPLDPLLDRVLDVAVMTAFAMFLFGIARLGLAFIPVMTNTAWLAAYTLLIISVYQRPDIYAEYTRRNALFLLAALVATLSVFWSLTPVTSAQRGILLILNLYVGFMIYQRLGLRRIVISVFWFAFAVQFLSVVLFIIGHPSTFNNVGTHTGLYLHKNTIAMHSGLLYFTSLVLLGAGRYRFIAVAGALLAILNIILSTSGSGLVVSALMTSLLLGCAIISQGHGVTAFVVGAALIVAGSAVATLLILGIDVLTLALDALGKDATFTGRTVLWDYALASFAEHPLLGVGYFAYWHAPGTGASSIWAIAGVYLDSFHNIYLDVLVAIGLVGFIPFVCALVQIVWRAGMLFLANPTPYLAWSFACASFIVIYGFSEYPIFWNGEFQLLLSILAGATCGVRAFHQSEPREVAS